MRRDCRDSTKYRLPTQVLVYCYRQNAGHVEYLMLRRTAKYGGFWQGVTGAPEGMESLLQAAGRELLEETRLFPRDIQQVAFSYSFPVDRDWKWAYHPDVTSIEEYVFLAEIADDADPVLSFEHDSYEWASFERAMGLLKWHNNRKALEFCDRLLQRNIRPDDALAD
jgi:8-oxo-dGTP pyrophosphatase MutT (NUDIX family)